MLTPETHHVLQTKDEEIDVPEEMEGVLDDLFQSIQDKVPGVGPRLLKWAHPSVFRIPWFAGQQPKALAGSLRDFPRTSPDKY